MSRSASRKGKNRAIESLSEYGSGWEWEENKYPHVFDSATSREAPFRLINKGTKLDVCSQETQYTDGIMLYSKSQMTNQLSCKPNIGNVGNLYQFSAIIVNGDITAHIGENSICPSHWQAPTNNEFDSKSFQHILYKTYKNIKLTDLLRPPFSFIYSGVYGGGTPNYRESQGYFATTSGTIDFRYYALYMTEYNNSFDINYYVANYFMGSSYGSSLHCSYPPNEYTSYPELILVTTIILSSIN